MSCATLLGGMFHGEPRGAPRARCLSPCGAPAAAHPSMAGRGRPPPVLVPIGMPIAPSIRLPLGWPPDGVLACHPYARRGGERDGRALTPPRGAYAGHGQRDGLVVTAARHGGVLRRPRHPPQGPWS